MLASMTEFTCKLPGLAITRPLFICYLVTPLTKTPTLSPASP
jgi:hypothetical protein